jgi:mRNA interferase MazF
VPKRGDVYMARLEPREGSERGGERPVIIMSRDSINQNSPVVVIVPVTDRGHKRRLYPSHVVLSAGDGGLTKESVALGEQVRAINTTRFAGYMGHLSSNRMTQIASALKIVLDL